MAERRLVRETLSIPASGLTGDKSPPSPLSSRNLHLAHFLPERTCVGNFQNYGAGRSIFVAKISCCKMKFFQKHIFGFKMFVKFQVCGWGVQGVGGVGCKSVRLQDGAACSLSQGSYNQKEKQKKVKKNDTDKLSLITQQTTTTLPMPRGTNLLMRCWTRSLNPISALTSLLNLNLYLQPLLCYHGMFFYCYLYLLYQGMLFYIRGCSFIANSVSE